MVEGVSIFFIGEYMDNIKKYNGVDLLESEISILKNAKKNKFCRNFYPSKKTDMINAFDFNSNYIKGYSLMNFVCRIAECLNKNFGYDISIAKQLFIYHMSQKETIQKYDCFK